MRRETEAAASDRAFDPYDRFGPVTAGGVPGGLYALDGDVGAGTETGGVLASCAKVRVIFSFDVWV